MKELNRIALNQNEIIHLISNGESINKILEFIVLRIEKALSPKKVYASVLIIDPINNTLGNMVSASIPEGYKKAISPVNVAPYEGSCGTAAFFKSLVITQNIDTDPLWEKYRSIASDYGFKACWSVPILSSKKELLGTFALYHNNIYEPNAEMIEKLETYNRLAAIAMELSNVGKRTSANQITHRFNLEQKEKSDDMLRSQLHNALIRGEFALYYQPYFDLKQKNVGLEALIRWNHSNLGILPPHSFLPIAEESGFILELEAWVLNEAIKDIKVLHEEERLNVNLSVNISAAQFEDPNYPELISNTLNQFAYQPEGLTLEVTERFLVHPDNVDILHQLKKTGVNISIDDFGTSYSSLQYLKDLPIDELKIDRSFISNMETDLNKQKIVEMIILLGQQLNLNIVAEGVETDVQLQLLKNMKCDRVQGFLFSKPVPLSNLKRNCLKRMEEQYLKEYIQLRKSTFFYE